LIFRASANVEDAAIVAIAGDRQHRRPQAGGIALDHRGHLTFDDPLQPLTATSTITSPQSKPSACIAFTISKGHR
jgi:hypothetical protein